LYLLGTSRTQDKCMIRINETDVKPTTRIHETNVMIGIELRIHSILVDTFNVVHNMPFRYKSDAR